MFNSLYFRSPRYNLRFTGGELHKQHSIPIGSNFKLPDTPNLLHSTAHTHVFVKNLPLSGRVGSVGRWGDGGNFY
ncbi:MAG: hypothetical protein F6J90_41825 [Moorea sp. SIOASIH]|uniref:hypothetical protein n=1 Tax=Moorena sp. SIOASIH TaxID=2607817 RepID=UPI0013BB421C|nr:hypothetical protein [Moorena sp. SIOASIH]NEO42512.1 hypothetical protein [Moorena sp. SIOASIH]